MKTLFHHLIQTKRGNITLLFVLFAASFIFRFCMAFFFKHIASYPDELFYYQMAESFGKWNGWLVYNHSTGLQKILYSFIISPVFLFESREIQQLLIAFINTFCICSSIFPAYFIACRLLKNNFSILLILIVALLLPDLCFNITFMIENIFLPLSLWLFYFFMRLFESKNNIKIIHTFLLGAFCYICYLSKEITLFFILAFFAMIFVTYFFRINNKKTIWQIKDAFFIFAGFFICYVFFKLFLFQQHGNFYSAQISNIGNLPEEYYFQFIFFCLINYLLCALIAGGFFPFILPIVFWKSLNTQHQRLFIFIILLVFGTALTLSYSIYVREMDFYLPAPRSLLRYLCYLWIPLFCLFLAFLEYKLPKKNISFLFIAMLPAFLIFFIFKGSYGIFTVDSMMLHFIDARFPVEYIINFKILLIILVCVVALFFHQNQNKIILFLFTLMMLGFIFNNYKNITEMRPFYAVSENKKIEMLEIEKFIKNNSDKNFLIANNQWWYNLYQPLADTFLNYKNVYTTNIEYFLRMDDSDILVKDYNIPLLWLYSNDLNKTYQTDKIDFVILPKKIDIHFANNKKPKYFITIKNSQLLQKHELFEIYQMQNPQILPKIRVEF